MRNIKLVFLLSFGHTGIDWLHSLLDSHKQILITPALSFYRCWKLLDADKAKTSDDMYNLWYQYINKYIGPNSKNKQKQLLHSDIEMNDFFIKFRKSLIVYGINKIDVFWSIQYAYAYAKNININDKVVVISHEHLPWPFEHILKDFPESNILMIIRDPRASIAGLFYGREMDFGILPDFTFNTTIEEWLQSQEMWNKYKKFLGKKLKIVKNEDMHENLVKSLTNISNWLNIDFSESLLSPTFATGEYAPADSKYLNNQGGVENIIVNLDIFYLPDNIKSRWLNVLSKNEIQMIENPFFDIFKHFNYERITKYNIILHRISILFFIFPFHRGLVKQWIRQYPNCEDFKKIGTRLSNSNNYRSYYLWKIMPNTFKMFAIFIHSIIRRIIILYFPFERWNRHDHPIKVL